MFHFQNHPILFLRIFESGGFPFRFQLLFSSYRMKKVKGQSCIVSGCKKRKKNKEQNSQGWVRSDSEGSDDDESMLKRMYPRTFHA